MPTQPRRLHRGPDLPYELLAAVEPCPGGWLVVSAKLLGINAYAEPPRVVPTFREILDNVPTYRIIAVQAPIGLPAVSAAGGRACDRDARRLLGFPRRGAILSAPTPAALNAPDDFEKASALNGGHLDVITWRTMPKIAELAAEVQSYHQRFVHEVSPELTYYALNENKPMRYPKRTQLGQDERRQVLGARIQGVQGVYDARLPRVRPWHLTDAVANLWAARKIAGRGVTRLPENPEWNDEGLRMEIVF